MTNTNLQNSGLVAYYDTGQEMEWALNAPSDSSKTLTLYKSYTYLLTYYSHNRGSGKWWESFEFKAEHTQKSCIKLGMP